MTKNSFPLHIKEGGDEKKKEKNINPTINLSQHVILWTNIKWKV